MIGGSGDGNDTIVGTRQWFVDRDPRPRVVTDFTYSAAPFTDYGAGKLEIVVSERKHIF